MALGAGMVWVLVLTGINPTHLRWFPEEVGSTSILWGLWLPAFGIAFLLSVIVPAARVRVFRSPARWFAAYAVWHLGLTMIADIPFANFALAAGYLFVALGASAVVWSGGWEAARPCIGTAVALVMTASALLLPFASTAERFQGVTGHPNTLGATAAVGAIVFLDRFLRGSMWALMFVGLAAVLLIASDSRTPLIGAAMGAIILLADVLPRGSVSLATIALVAAAALFTQTDTLADNAASLSRSGNEAELQTLTGRTEIWDLSVDAIRERPIAGYGLGATKALFERIKPEELFGDFEIFHGHNMLVQAALTGGLPAAILIVAGFTSYAARARTAPAKDRDALVVLLAIAGITEPVLSSSPSMFFAILALAFASTHHHHQTDSTPEDLTRRQPSAV